MRASDKVVVIKTTTAREHAMPTDTKHDTKTRWFYQDDPGEPFNPPVLCEHCECEVGPWDDWDNREAGVTEYWESDAGRIVCWSCWRKGSR